MISSPATEVLLVKNDNGVEDLIYCVVIPNFSCDHHSGISLREGLDYFSKLYSEEGNSKQIKDSLRLCSRLMTSEIMGIGSNFSEYGKYSIHFIVSKREEV